MARGGKVKNACIALLALLAATSVLAGESASVGQYAQDRIIVKFKVPVSIGQQNGPVRTGIGDIDALNQVWQVAGARRLCPAATSVPVPIEPGVIVVGSTAPPEIR